MRFHPLLWGYIHIPVGIYIFLWGYIYSCGDIYINEDVAYKREYDWAKLEDELMDHRSNNMETRCELQQFLL